MIEIPRNPRYALLALVAVLIVFQLGRIKGLDDAKEASLTVRAEAQAEVDKFADSFRCVQHDFKHGKLRCALFEQR